MKKYEVFVEDDCVGVYYAETEDEAVKEAKTDFIYLSDGKKFGLRECGYTSRQLMFQMRAREVDY